MRQLCFFIRNAWVRKVLSGITLTTMMITVMYFLGLFDVPVGLQVRYNDHRPVPVSTRKNWPSVPRKNASFAVEPIYTQSTSKNESGCDKRPAWVQYNATFDEKSEFYDPQGVYMERLLNDLATIEIKDVNFLTYGTQFKLWIDFVDGNRAMAKPKRTERDFYFPYERTGTGMVRWANDVERHTAEIAAFHLDRILDFRKIVPCIGRSLNFTSDIVMKTKDPNILNTLVMKDGNQCVIGNCSFCKTNNPVCAEDGLLEVSLCQAIPRTLHMGTMLHIWYDAYLLSEEEALAKCTKQDKVVKKIPEYFFDAIETSLFDHLIVNYDRHNVKILTSRNLQESGIGRLDNGKGFGNPLIDELGFLIPIKTCCRFRNSTYRKLVGLQKVGNTLGDLMKASLSRDPLAPILTDEFYPALDRRLAQAVAEIEGCVKKYGEYFVLK